MNKYLCIHSHFYQPPRENPWLEDIVLQESAYPFHDWNDRITEECYRANSESRIMDDEGWVVQLSNNYSKISFNFGPTLLSWMEDHDPSTYQRILDGDKQSQEYFSGHGSAIAQVYNHIILPLANRRDKETQVLWGLRDFQRRFGRDPESMWLAETGVDTETLEILSDNGLKYVIMAPRQAKAIRALGNGSGEWQDVSAGTIDPKQPYLINLPSGRTIVGFFYDGAISQAVAFEGLLHNGISFAQRLMTGFDPSLDTNQLLHIATDGETYGHHHRHGDMALAYAIHHIETQKLARITNYAEYLENNPPQMEAEIHENSSWSCVHGVERWRANCGCNSGGNLGWNQKWRKPLREAFDFLRDHINPSYENFMAQYNEDAWAIRDDYIHVIENRSKENINAFTEKWCGKVLEGKELHSFLKALEIQRHLLLMYTSCAWFFDELSGIETVQVLQYASRAIELAQDVFELDIEKSFKDLLKEAPSNMPDLKTGDQVWDKYVIPARVGMKKIGVHFAVSSLFEEAAEASSIYCFEAEVLDHYVREAGRAHIACGQVKITSRITFESAHLHFGVIHFGDHNVNAGVAVNGDRQDYAKMKQELDEGFKRADWPAVLRTLDKHLGSPLFSLKDLFKDEQKKVINEILKQTVDSFEGELVSVYQRSYPLICYLSDIQMQLPTVFRHIAEFVHNRGIRSDLINDREPVDVADIRKLLSEARNWALPLDEAGILHNYETALKNKVRSLKNDPTQTEVLAEVLDLIELGSELPFTADFGDVQNQYYRWCEKGIEEDIRQGQVEVEDTEAWLRFFDELGEKLKVRKPTLRKKGQREPIATGRQEEAQP